MWPDNETDIDLLGFDFLIDELLVLLKEPRLLPVTIGVTGDWGSGKSSLLAMAAKELDADKTADFIVVPFSPWKFEGYEDVKAALMQAVMRALHKAVADDKTNAKQTKELFLGLVGRLWAMLEVLVDPVAGYAVPEHPGSDSADPAQHHCLHRRCNRSALGDLPPRGLC